MTFAISIKTVGVAGEPIRRLRSRFAQFEVAPSMTGLEYPPHLTLALYDQIEESKLRAAFHAVFDGQPAVRVEFNRLSHFEQPQLVFWAAPEHSEVLMQMHREIHRLIDRSLCREHYRPNAWVPHCTIGTAIRDIHRSAAIDLAGQSLQPFEVTFECADCVEFYPVRGIDEIALRPSPLHPRG